MQIVKNTTILFDPEKLSTLNFQLSTKKEKPRKSFDLRGFSFALQDGLEPTTP